MPNVVFWELKTCGNGRILVGNGGLKDQTFNSGVTVEL